MFFYSCNVFLLSLLFSVFSGNKEIIPPMIIILVAIIMILYRAIKAGNNAYKLFGDREVKYFYIIDENEISFEVYDEDILKDRGKYILEDIKSFLTVKRYSFIRFKDGKFIFLDNNTFREGTLQVFKEMVKKCQKIDLKNRGMITI